MTIGRIKNLVLQCTPSFLAGLNYIAMVAKLSAWCRKNPCQTYNDRFSMYESLVKPTDRIDYLEFGVGNAESLKWWLNYNRHGDSRFRGYDIFTGLPEKWMRLPKSAFAQSLPEIADPRCEIIVGMFQQTMLQRPQFHGGKILIHLDADLYSSTLYVLTTVKPPAGSILIFDEFSAPMHEFKAFSEYVESHYVNYRLLGRTANYTQVATEILA